MTTKAIITRRGGTPRTDTVSMSESVQADKLGLNVEQEMPHGTLVTGKKKQYEALQAQGYRIKLLTDTNILLVGSYKIDTETSPPKVPAKLEVPKELRETWPHHLVQLSAPPNEDWVRTIEEQGVDVVEPISAYGLFVVGSPAQVKKLESLPFVEWVGPFKPAYRIAPNLDGMKGRIQYVSIIIFPETGADEVRKAVQKARGAIISESTKVATYGGQARKLLVEVDAGALPDLACMPAVRWIDYQGPDAPSDERSSQIVAENLNGVAAPNTAPVTGYQASLTALGLSGAGVIVGIVDDGVDTHNNATMHADLAGRMAFFVDASGGATTVDVGGHGTHVAGIAVGNAATGDTDPQGFLLGMGVAPGAQFGSVNPIGTGGPFMPDNDRVGHVVNHNGQVMNNSWGAAGSGVGYTDRSQTYDQRVRDPVPGTAGLEHIVIVSAAGNEGGGDTTIGAPWEAKNPIVVGNSLNFRPGELFPGDDIRGISGTSSRGPAVDTRIFPTIVAPGTNIISARATVDSDPVAAGVQRPFTAYTDTGGTIHNNHTALSGTSMASPHIAGLCALLTEWWRNRTGGRNPSAALVKALLINGAEDLAGGQNWRCLNRIAADKALWSLDSGNIFKRVLTFTPADVAQSTTMLTQVASLANITAQGQWFFNAGTNTIFVRMIGNTNPGLNGVNFLDARDTVALANIPNRHQGWGRASLENIVLQSPDSDRGPKIFSNQRHAFTANGQEFNIRVAPADASRPLRVTLVWTDAAAAPGDNPALINDLDLEVVETGTGNVFKGNVNFVNGFSTPAAALDNFDNRNNVECVYIQNPAGTYEINIVAAHIVASARPDIATPWQDFALVIDNAEVNYDTPVSVVPIIDRSGSMVSAGYVDITKTSSKQFVDLMSIDDDLGVVSFGDTSTVEFPAGGPPTLQNITSQMVRDTAKSEIDGITFGGCTFMGAGINAARDLLAPAAGSRAMVMLSDGYDNKGCDPGNPAKPSAMQAVAGLPANMPVYTCAMGPLSDQTLLADIAEATSGRYYYMPTIDDLFEIYNYIRGQVTGDAIIVNDSAMASSSKLAGFVDALATEATFSVAWADTKLKFAPGDPRKANEVSIRLRDPRGKLLHPSDSYVRRIVGKGYVVFKIQEPMAGQWFVEVSTQGDTHVRYTVGGFVKSPLRMIVSLRPGRVIPGGTLSVATQMFDGKKRISSFNADKRVVHANLNVAGLLKKFKNKLRDIKPANLPGGDSLPVDISKLIVLRDNLLRDKKSDPFLHDVDKISLRNVAFNALSNLNFGHLIVPDILPISAPAALSGILIGNFKDTKQAGSYNVVVDANGTSSVSGTRFVRKALVSVLVK